MSSVNILFHLFSESKQKIKEREELEISCESFWLVHWQESFLEIQRILLHEMVGRMLACDC